MAEEPHEGLSERELEILRLVATGVTNREIALRLVISPNTVKVHLRNIFTKLGVESRTEATLVAIQNGWVQVPATPGEETSPVPSLPPLSWPRRAFLLAALVGAFVLTLWPRGTSRSASGSSALFDPVRGNSTGVGVDSVQRWGERTALPVARQRFACASLGGLVFAIGGDTARGVSADVEVYDPASDRGWERRAAKPTAASNVGAAVLGDEIFVPGGSDGEQRVLTAVEVYRPATDSWRSVSPLPAPRCAYAVAAAGGRLYLFGGWDGTRYVADVLIYDPQSDTWSYGTPMGHARGFAAAAAVDGRIYVVGGYDEATESASCELYDPTLEGSGQSPWKALAPMSQARGGLGLAAVGNQLYAVGGGWTMHLAYNEIYDIARDRWRSFPTPIVGRWRTLGVTAVPGTLGTTVFAIGGWTDGPSTVNQAYRASVSVYFPALP